MYRHARPAPHPRPTARSARLARFLRPVLLAGVGGLVVAAMLPLGGEGEALSVPEPPRSVSGAPGVASPAPTLPASGADGAPGPADGIGTEDPRRIELTRTLVPPAQLTGYVWPLPNARLTLGFGPSRWGSRLVDGERFHDGIDLATFCGDRIHAAHDGVVLAAGRRYDHYMGWRGDLAPYLERLDRKQLWSTLPIVVVTDDGNGYRSIYAHFSKVVVKAGDVVEAGQLIGFEGRTGRASGCHLHYGLFAPLERRTFEIAPDVVQRMKLPAHQTARIDPLLVLPPP